MIHYTAKGFNFHYKKVEVVGNKILNPYRTILRAFLKLKKTQAFSRTRWRKVAPILYKGSITLFTWSIRSKAQDFYVQSGSRILSNITRMGMGKHKEWEFTSGAVKSALQRLSLEELWGAGYLLMLDYLEIRQLGSRSTLNKTPRSSRRGAVVNESD